MLSDTVNDNVVSNIKNGICLPENEISKNPNITQKPIKTA